MTIKELKENFDVLNNEEIYSYLLDLSSMLPVYPKEYMVEKNKVKGCASSVYFKLQETDKKIKGHFFSDSKILSGVLYIFYLNLENKDKKEANKINWENIIKDFKLNEILSSQRQNGIFSLINQLKQILKYDII